ncbi:MAG: hypothetical protein WD847_09335 [Pirellulales bacterium]
MRSVLNRVGMVAALVLGCGSIQVEASDAWGGPAYGGAASTAAFGGGYGLWGIDYGSSADCCSDVWDGYCDERHGWGCGHGRRHGDCRGSRRHGGGLFHRHRRCHGGHTGSCCHGEMDHGMVPGPLGPIDDPPAPVADNAA